MGYTYRRFACFTSGTLPIKSIIAAGESWATVFDVRRPDANPPMMPYSDQYQLVEVDADYLAKAVKPKQFIHIDQSECIMCEGCVDICPWKCIHMVSPTAVAEAEGTEKPGVDPNDNVIFTIDDDICTRCALCVDRCPTGVIVLGKVGVAPAGGDVHARTNNHGYAYGMRL